MSVKIRSVFIEEFCQVPSPRLLAQIGRIMSASPAPVVTHRNFHPAFM